MRACFFRSNEPKCNQVHLKKSISVRGHGITKEALAITTTAETRKRKSTRGATPQIQEQDGNSVKFLLVVSGAVCFVSVASICYSYDKLRNLSLIHI